MHDTSGSDPDHVGVGCARGGRIEPHPTELGRVPRFGHGGTHPVARDDAEGVPVVDLGSGGPRVDAHSVTEDNGVPVRIDGQLVAGQRQDCVRGSPGRDGDFNSSLTEPDTQGRRWINAAWDLSRLLWHGEAKVVQGFGGFVAELSDKVSEGNAGEFTVEAQAREACSSGYGCRLVVRIVA